MNPDFSRQSRDKKNKLQDRSRLRKAQSLVSITYKSFCTIMFMKIARSLILFVK